MKPGYILFMLFLLVSLGSYIFFFERGPAPQNQDMQAVSNTPILSLDLDALDALELSQNAPASSITLSKKDGQWLYEGQKAEQSRIENILRQLTPWQASRVLEENFDTQRAEEFGLKTPDMIIRLKQAGKETVLQIGSQTPGSTGYYVTRTGTPELFLSYVNVPEDLRRLLTNPPLPKTTAN